MRWTWLGVLTLALVGCDGNEPLPREEIGTEGPTDDDDDPSMGTTTSASEATTTTPDPTTGPDSDPATSTTASDESSGGAETTTGVPTDPCSGGTTNITQEGNVLASSVFDTLLGPAYEAELAVDGDVATSWFSAGPSADGTESTYEWYTQLDHCIDGVAVIGNAMHSNPDFREGFGFESATLEVLDTSGDTVFSQELDLSGTPDPDQVIDTGGVLGNQIVLRLRGHESEDCGGFAELAIDGRPQR